jgi:hypothetical protein
MEKYHCYQLRTKLYPNQVNLAHWRNFLGGITVDSDVIDEYWSDIFYSSDSGEK